MGHFNWLAREIFPLSQVLLQKTNIVSGGEGDERSLQNTKGAKCPRTFGQYCLVLKFFKTRYTCNVLVGQGVIDGAENDGDI